ncbi:hypothetical protein [Paraglaciecola sp. 25GB23A]|uniref:hypothetical protein n=1 Tax=Paraglaciecola sp. 25GB23A TaxID=3156068 RepID=UPI0032AF872B
MELEVSDIRNVKKNMLILMTIWPLLDLAIFVYRQEFSILIRLCLTCALFFMIYRGKNWARQLFLIFAMLGLIIGVGASIYFATISIWIGVGMLLFTVVLATLPSYLVFNKKAKAYFVSATLVKNSH